MPKRYYWLKLKDDFFGSKRIKKLRNMAGGDTYLIIYLKMQLLAMKTEGVLTWTGLEDDFAAELALDLDEKPSDVEMTLLYLLNTGLAETQDNRNFYFPYAVENTGSEGASAERQRRYIARKALLNDALRSPDDSGVTRDSHFADGEKEIEKEIEKESEKEYARARLKTREDEKDDGFQAFWSAYPKKNGGDIREAFMEYDHAVSALDVSPEDLIKAAEDLAEATAPEEIRFLPNAAKWLRNRGWETKPVKAEPKKQSYTTAAEAKPRTKIDTSLLDAVKSAMQQETE